MKSKNKYIASVLMASMFLTSPLAYAAEDDVVVFGGEFEEKVDTPNSENEVVNDDSESNTNESEDNTGNEPKIIIELPNNDDIVNHSNDEKNDNEIIDDDELNLEDSNSNEDGNISINVPVERLNDTNENKNFDVHK